MKLLMDTLRTAFAARRYSRTSSESGGPAQPDALPTADGQQVEAPAWRLLGEQTGVQDRAYGDIARPNVQRLFRHTPRRLLDVGCASGAVGADLKQTIGGLWVWGCELNQQAAELAASRLDRISNAPRPQWNAEELALVESLDTVLFLDVLEHMYNPWAELEFFAQRLPADAQVIVSLPNVGHLSVLEDLSHGRFQYWPIGILDVTHVRFFTFDGMQAMFRQTGFDVEASCVLSGAETVAIKEFPARVATGKLVIEVESAEEWERLNAVQFGFRLRPQRASTS